MGCTPEHLAAFVRHNIFWRFIHSVVGIGGLFLFVSEAHVTSHRFLSFSFLICKIRLTISTW